MSALRFFGRNDEHRMVGFKHGDVERLARARERFHEERQQRPMVLKSVAHGRTPADGAVIGMRRGVRPLLDPEVVACIGPIEDHELPAFIQSRLVRP